VPTRMVHTRSLQTAFHEARRDHQARRFAAAIAGYRAFIKLDPTHAQSWHGLGIACLQINENGPAIDALQHAVSLDGTNAVFHNNLGVALLAGGILDKANNAFAHAVRLDNDYADALANLGMVHKEQRRTAEAIQFYREALRSQPKHINALFNLANLLYEEGELEQASALYRDALHAGGPRSDILNNHGRVLLDLSQVNEAIDAFEQALIADPGNGEAAFNAAKAYAKKENWQQAERFFTTASCLRRNKSLWRYQRLGLCPTVFQSIAELDDYRAELNRHLDDAIQVGIQVDLDELAFDGFVPSFNLAHHGRSNRHLLEKFACLYSPHISKRNPLPFSQGAKRVGFVVTSPHVGSFLRTQGGIVERLDPARFRIFLFCDDAGIKKMRAAICRNDIHWIPFSRRFGDAVATIAAAKCDVLYFHKVSADPLGYLLPFARLAPVQCTSWATHFTSGVGEVDYYLSSNLVESADAAKEYTEQLVRFKTFPAYEKKPPRVPPAARSDFGLPTQGALYLCPQRLAKFHPAQDELFRQILEEDEAGTIVILSADGSPALDHLLTRFQRTLGAGAKRIRILPSQSAVGLAQLMSVCDALLDIRHYSVSLMAKDAFAAQLPIVTYPGDLKVERYTLGFYRKMGIEDLIATSAEGYVRLAIRLGNEPDFRREMKNRIALASDLLFDDRQTIREFEDFVDTVTLA